MRERQYLDTAITSYKDVAQQLEDNVEMIALGEAEGDTAIIDESEAALRILLETVQKRQLEALLSGEADGNDCFVELHSGAGGTESQYQPKTVPETQQNPDPLQLTDDFFSQSN